MVNTKNNDSAVCVKKETANKLLKSGWNIPQKTHSMKIEDTEFVLDYSIHNGYVFDISRGNNYGPTLSIPIATIGDGYFRITLTDDFVYSVLQFNDFITYYKVDGEYVEKFTEHDSGARLDIPFTAGAELIEIFIEVPTRATYPGESFPEGFG